MEPVTAETRATAIRIGNPASWQKAARSYRQRCGGWCEQVSEQEIALAKAEIGAEGVGCEPASAVTLAGLKKLVAQGRVQREERWCSPYRPYVEGPGSIRSTITVESCCGRRTCGRTPAERAMHASMASRRSSWMPMSIRYCGAWRRRWASPTLERTSKTTTDFTDERG